MCKGLVRSKRTLTSDKIFEQQTFDHESHKELSFDQILATKVQFLDICNCQIESRLTCFFLKNTFGASVESDLNWHFAEAI